MLCVVIKGPTFKEVHEQIIKALPFADLLELRLDCFQTLDLDALKALRSQYSIPMIFTLRCKSQGGNYLHAEEHRLESIRSLLTLNPEYFDLEYGVSKEFIQEVASQFPEVKVILSYHNFSETPKDLDGLYREMKLIPAFYYKVALFSKNCIDTLRVLVWAKNADHKLIAISMGTNGEASRILAPIIGTPITYATLSDDLTSAPGQLTAETLLKRYNSAALTRNTSIFGLIGYPVSQSISDSTHNYLMKTCNLDAIYVKIAVSPAELNEFMQLAKHLPFRGLSVTAPLKEQILPLLDLRSANAIKMGAVNTLLFEDGKVSGFNTDGIGAFNVIERQLLVKNKHIVILGAGGAARAIAYEAVRREARVTILNRSPEKADEIASRYHCEGYGLDQMEECARAGYDVLINCTTAALPIKPEHLLPDSYVMDIVTKPKESEFLKRARQKGCKVIFGYQMFIEQAIAQFDLWFKGKIDHELSKNILEKKAIEIL